MMKYKVELEEVSLKDAVKLIKENKTVFYTYGIGKPIYSLDDNAVATSILSNAIYLTPCSFVNVKTFSDRYIEDRGKRDPEFLTVLEKTPRIIKSDQ